MKINKLSNPAFSKGYRLRPATHKMIKKIQAELNTTQDRVVSSALKMYNIHIKNVIKINKGE